MNAIWFLLLPLLLLFFIFPLQIHGPINLLDEGTWLATAQALSEGKTLYRDTWLPYGPVLPLALKTVFAFTSPTLSLVRGVFWFLNAAGLLTIYFCLLRFVRSFDLRVAFACFLTMVPLTTHASIPMSARYGAGFLALLVWTAGSSRQSVFPKWAVACGILAVLSFWISQEVGVAALLASAYFYARHPLARNALKPYLLGCGAAAAAALGAISWHSGIRNYVQSAVVETGQVVATHHLGFPVFIGSIFRRVQTGEIPWYVAGQQAGDVVAFYFPVILYVGVLSAAWFGRLFSKEDRHKAVSLAIYGVLTACTAWGRSDRWHLYFALSPALLLTAYVADRFRAAHPKPGQKVVLCVIILGCLLTVPHQLARSARMEWLRTQTRETIIARAGSVKLPFAQANGYEALVAWTQAHTAPGEPVLFFPYNGSAYFLSDRPNPCRLPTLVFAATPAMQKRSIDELERSGARWVIWDKENTGFDGIPMETYLNLLTEHIRMHFAPRQSVGPFEFWERKKPGG